MDHGSHKNTKNNLKKGLFNIAMSEKIFSRKTRIELCENSGSPNRLFISLYTMTLVKLHSDP